MTRNACPDDVLSLRGGPPASGTLVSEPETALSNVSVSKSAEKVHATEVLRYVRPVLPNAGSEEGTRRCRVHETRNTSTISPKNARQPFSGSQPHLEDSTGLPHWSTNLVHDLQNAIGTLRVNFDFLEQVVSGRLAPETADLKECREDTDAVFKSLITGFRMVALLEQLTNNRRPPTEAHFDGFELFKEIVNDQEPVAARRGRMLSVQTPESGREARGDEAIIRFAIAELLMFWIRRTGTRRIDVQVQDGAPLRFRLTIENGTGELDFNKTATSAFAPYPPDLGARTVEDGLALPLARAVCRRHQGDLAVDSSKQRGPSDLVLVGTLKV